MSPAASQVLFLIVFIAIMYLLLIRPQKKKEKAINLMRSNLRVGDEVITIGGICGKIVKIRDETLTIQVGADKVKFEMMRWAISRVVESSELKSDMSSRKRAPVDESDDESGERKKTMPKKMKRSSEERGRGAEIDDEDDDDAGEQRKSKRRAETEIEE